MLKKVPLRDLFEVRSSKRVLKSQWQSSGVPFYRGREITLLSKQGYVDNELFIAEESFNEFAKKYGVPQPEDIVITAIGTIGNSYIVRENDRFYFKDASVLWLKKISEVDSCYINLWLKSSQMREQLDEGNGATVDTLTIKKLQSLVIDLPPLDEQKRIVAIVDQVFANIEKARAIAKTNLKNVRELFDSYLQRVFGQCGEGRETYRLGDLCELISGQHIDAKNYNSEQRGIGYLTGPSDFGQINPLVTKWTEHPKKTAVKGDILITVKGSGIGKINVMNDQELAISRQLMAIRPTIAKGEILYWFISMQYKYFQSLANGAAIPGISRGDVLDLKLRLPDEKKQDTIIKEISEFNSKIDELRKVYERKVSVLDELKKSILQKAFTGELTKSKGIAA